MGVAEWILENRLDSPGHLFRPQRYLSALRAQPLHVSPAIVGGEHETVYATTLAGPFVGYVQHDLGILALHAHRHPSEALAEGVIGPRLEAQGLRVPRQGLIVVPHDDGRMC